MNPDNLSPEEYLKKMQQENLPVPPEITEGWKIESYQLMVKYGTAPTVARKLLTGHPRFTGKLFNYPGPKGGQELEILYRGLSYRLNDFDLKRVNKTGFWADRTIGWPWAIAKDSPSEVNGGSRYGVIMAYQFEKNLMMRGFDSSTPLVRPGELADESTYIYMVGIFDKNTAASPEDITWIPFDEAFQYDEAAKEYRLALPEMFR